MENILYFDIKSGISGDMTIASLLDLGLDQDKFLEELKKLNLAGYEIVISTVQKNGITAKDFKVILDDDSHPDHVEVEHQHEHSNHQGGCNGCGNHDHSEAEHNDSHHEQSHEDEHSHSHSSSHVHRNFNDIKELINQSDLSQKVKDLSN